MIWRCRDRVFDLSARTLVMGVVNVTPDSFSDGGRFFAPGAAIAHARQLLAEGADLLDLGAESTRPGAAPVTAAEQIRRLAPVLEALAADPRGCLAVDTASAGVAARALELGARIVNDVTALADPGMAAVVARSGAGLVLMHMAGTPATMQQDPHYEDVTREVRGHLAARLEAAGAAGVPAERVALDPGIGFGKIRAPQSRAARPARGAGAPRPPPDDRGLAQELPREDPRSARGPAARGRARRQRRRRVPRRAHRAHARRGRHGAGGAHRRRAARGAEAVGGPARFCYSRARTSDSRDPTMTPVHQIWLLDLLDIFLVALLFYRLLVLVKGTRSGQMYVGLLLIVLVGLFARAFDLIAVKWIVDSVKTIWLIAFVILFQPELRHVLAQFGRTRYFRSFLRGDSYGVLGEVVRAAETLGKKRQGALLVIERNTGLRNFVETGTRLDAKVTAELLVTLFSPGSPLHDGAVILREDSVVAASCILPLSSNPKTATDLGTRHRAALGLSEESDAAVVVVSEQTGGISVAFRGTLKQRLDSGELRSELSRIFHLRPEEEVPPLAPVAEGGAVAGTAE